MTNRDRHEESAAGNAVQSLVPSVGRRERFRLVCGMALIIVLLAATSCSAGSAGTGATPAAADTKVSLLTLFRAGLAIQLDAGAAQAAKEYGAEYNWFGPPGLDPPTQIKALQDAVSAGATGVATMAFPGELWVRPIDNATSSGATVVTLDTPSEGSTATTHFGPSKYALGTALADAFSTRLGPDAHGYIQPGICVPGLPSLTSPFTGFTERMKEIQPGVSVREAVNTTGDPSTNFAAWQRIIEQEPDALGFIGNCDQDVPNLVKIKQDTGGKYLIGATSGDSPENLASVRDGVMDVIVGQSGFVEGYLTMHYLLASLVDHKPLPKGWVNTGYEVITKDNAAQILTRNQADPTAADGALAYNKKIIDQIVADPAPRPIADNLTASGAAGS